MEEPTLSVVDPHGASAPVLGRRRALATLFGGVVGLTACTPGSADEAAGGAVDETSPDTIPSGADDYNANIPPIEGRDPELHAVRRLTFGSTSADVERVRSMGLNAWLDEQLDPDSLETNELEERLLDAVPELGQDTTTVLADFRASGNAQRLATALPSATLYRHVHSPAQLHERMVEFWSDHFNTPQTNPPSSAARIAMDREVFRPYALGRFDDLLVATAQSPAMLLYLDNFQSAVGAINENYARELLELHTVGIDGGYNEADIVATARLLTGWAFNRELEFMFRPARHDRAHVSILGWDRPNVGTPLEHGVSFLRHLAQLPQTARFVSRKLAVRFVADDPSDGIVNAMADAWLANDSEIGPVIRAMVTHADFADAPPKFNRPWDFMVQSLRSMQAEIDPEFGPRLGSVVGMVRDLGQVPFRYASPDGYPDSAAAWLNAGGLLARWNTAIQLADPGLPVNSVLRALPEAAAGSAATQVFELFAQQLRQEPLSDDHLSLLGDLTGWGLDQVPDREALEEATPYIAFTFLAHPTALFR
ncbi:MAG: DUF1800 domain-containing protein [Acidimicrobiales bacterium]|nr:DUF1800 domain-containing protein [Acidimicrobiales bacterium]